MHILNLYLALILGFTCLMFTVIFIEHRVSRSRSNWFTQWWRGNVIGENPEK